MIVSEVSGDNVKTESKILSVALDMMQGGMAMSYDSNKKDEDNNTYFYFNPIDRNI